MCSQLHYMGKFLILFQFRSEIELSTSVKISWASEGNVPANAKASYSQGHYVRQRNSCTYESKNPGETQLNVLGRKQLCRKVLKVKH